MICFALTSLQAEAGYFESCATWLRDWREAVRVEAERDENARLAERQTSRTHAERAVIGRRLTLRRTRSWMAAPPSELIALTALPSALRQKWEQAFRLLPEDRAEQIVDPELRLLIESGVFDDPDLELGTWRGLRMEAIYETGGGGREILMTRGKESFRIRRGVTQERVQDTVNSRSHQRINPAEGFRIGVVWDYHAMTGEDLETVWHPENSRPHVIRFNSGHRLVRVLNSPNRELGVEWEHHLPGTSSFLTWGDVAVYGVTWHIAMRRASERQVRVPTLEDFETIRQDRGVFRFLSHRPELRSVFWANSEYRSGDGTGDGRKATVRAPEGYVSYTNPFESIGMSVRFVR